MRRHGQAAQSSIFDSAFLFIIGVLLTAYHYTQKWQIAERILHGLNAFLPADADEGAAADLAFALRERAVAAQRSCCTHADDTSMRGKAIRSAKRKRIPDKAREGWSPVRLFSGGSDARAHTRPPPRHAMARA